MNPSMLLPLGMVSPGSTPRARATVIKPSAGTLPTSETGVASLLESLPEADGRGVRVAVLDTGCDLKAAGLQTTSDGQRKYIDFIDCTGGGDVDMSKKVKRSEDGSITGLSGRKLVLGPNVARGVDELRVGAVRLYTLLPDSVLSRVKAERKASFDQVQHAARTAVQRQVDGLAPSAAAAEKKDLEARLEQLKELMEKHDDAGPLMDLLLWKEGETWKAIVDVSCAGGDVSGIEPMAPFAVAGQVGELGFGSALSFCVQVYDEGDVLSLVTDAGSHGTHGARRPLPPAPSLPPSLTLLPHPPSLLQWPASRRRTSRSGPSSTAWLRARASSHARSVTAGWARLRLAPAWSVRSSPARPMTLI